MQACVDAADQLAAQGVQAEVIDLRTLWPWDKEAVLNSAAKTGRLLVVHEAPQTGGWAGEVLAVVAGSEAFDYLDAPVARVTGKADRDPVAETGDDSRNRRIEITLLRRFKR